MPTRMRLQRRGKKGRPYYHVVIADGRAPRDGRFIEKIGTYNPISKPAEINLDFDRALYWLQAGAQPTDTVRSLLAFRGVLYKNHLLKGVRKGALSEEMAEARFQEWLKDKEARSTGLKKEIDSAEREENRKRLEAEKKINQVRADTIAAKQAAELKRLEKEKATGESQEQPVEAAPEQVGDSTVVEAPEVVAETPAEAPADKAPEEIPENAPEEESPEEKPGE
ncbi:MAG: 30S ribosomal protein S16 [Bacteroidales bacterium]|nr:30S ribosomal protein S16 [Bacteroidales bacterium]